MKTQKLKLMAMALMACMGVFTACNDDDYTQPGNGDSTIDNNGTLEGTITSDLTLTSGNTYILNGEFIVKGGATLNIEPGVKIVAQYDDRVDFILVEQGGKINAEGTAEAPIVMTSSKEVPGAWGGIHICGLAHTLATLGIGMC